MNANRRFERRRTAGVSTVAMIAILAGPAGTNAQQDASGGKRPAFEVATVKLAAPDAIRNLVTPPPASPNRLFIPSMTLSALIYAAYGSGGFNTSMRVTGGPDWIGKTAFAVEGVAAGRATPREFRRMLQTLLEQRFALKIRTEMTTADMLTLVMARSDGTLGPNVTTWNGTCPKVMPALYFQAPRRPLRDRVPSEDDPAIAECPTGYRAGGISLDGVTMSTVAEVLSLPPARALLGTIVADQTGLTGRYTMELDYPFPPQRPADAAAPANFGLPSLFTAVQEQWGLRVVPGKGPFRLVVVESAQLPSAN
jgi:uncharacterized protein (TIGR03435 family)